MTNKRAAESLALETFDQLRPAQRRAILDALDVGTTPRIKTSTNSHSRRALERAGLVVQGLRDFTPWGLFVFASAKARQQREREEAARAARPRARRNRSQGQLFEAA